MFVLSGESARCPVGKIADVEVTEGLIHDLVSAR